MRTTSKTLKLTNPVIDRVCAERARGVKTIVRDAGCPGLSLVVNSHSASWWCAYHPKGRRPDGKQLSTRHLRLGDVKTMPLPDARLAWLKVKTAVAEGHDPAMDRRVKVAQRVEERKKERAMAEFLQDYLAWFDNRPVRPKTKVDERRQVMAALELTRAAELPPAEFRRAHVMNMLESVRGSARPLKLFQSLNSFLNFLLDREVIGFNPMAHIDPRRRPKAPKPRTRVLTLEEIGQIWRAAERLVPARGKQADAAIWRRLVWFTFLIPARNGEVSSMCWDHVNLTTGVWTQPDKLTKNGDQHTLPLPPLALALLVEQKAALERVRVEQGRVALPADAPVWIGISSGRHFCMWGKLLTHLRAASGVPTWTWHDIRRTVVTHLAEHGVAESVADALLNHCQSATRAGVMGVYQRAERHPERRQALEIWQGVVEEAAAKEG